MVTVMVIFPPQNIVELLLSSGYKLGGAATVERLVGDRDSEGQTCLHHAVNNGHIEVSIGSSTPTEQLLLPFFIFPPFFFPFSFFLLFYFFHFLN